MSPEGLRQTGSVCTARKADAPGRRTKNLSVVLTWTTSKTTGALRLWLAQRRPFTVLVSSHWPRQSEIQLCRATAMHDPYGRSLRSLFAQRNYGACLDLLFTRRAPQAHRPNRNSVSDEAQRSEPADAETG
ncbi:hypothetical protein [Bradyrhizobium lablabi]|uniref:hypothetical protein n=1 Tax=Bradyrhizobium lablabi TaxID=722472 RepID=UPI0012E39A51|nr:hypothetical protein [Bradyrhizobium lablabi]